MKKTCNLISLFLALLLATGCNNTDVLSPHSQAANIAEEKFLDLTDIPSEDIEILTKANERIKPYVEVKRVTCFNGYIRERIENLRSAF